VPELRPDWSEHSQVNKAATGGTNAAKWPVHELAYKLLANALAKPIAPG
jgi:hypothetical protein